MKSTVRAPSKSAKPFPKLMVTADGVVLFAGGHGDTPAALRGMVVGFVDPNNPVPNRLGEVSTTWFAKCFEDFDGEVVLQSE